MPEKNQSAIATKRLAYEILEAVNHVTRSC
jgi:hypothetical protein